MDTSYMESANRLIDVLEVFLNTPQGIGVVDLAKRSGNNATTSYRIASSLVKRGYLIQPRKRGKYYLSPKLLRFNSVIKMSNKVRDVACPFLRQLNSETKESVNLAILDGNEALYVEHIETDYNLRLFTQVGRRVPLHCTGIGKLFLANMADGELKSHLSSQELIRYTPNTITNVEQLEKELTLVRREGVAIDNEEFERGVKCVAAPINSITGYTVAAISMSAPSARIDGDIEIYYKTAVKEYALKISQDLGYMTE
jgi:DNA-binding IclR family transcriptional regulator